MTDATSTMPDSTLFSLKGRVALVTGASRGLGLEMARGLASFGAHVLINCRDSTRAMQSVSQLAVDGLSAEPLAFDVSDADASTRAFAWIGEKLGRLDIVVGNAAIRHRASLSDISAEDFSRVLDVNLSATFRIAKLAAQLMTINQYGRIILISSASSMIAPRGDAAYTAAKGGINALTRALAVELAERGITCNAIAPGSFLTEINVPYKDKFAGVIASRVPMKRWGEPRELAGLCVFLASEASSYMTGQVLLVDGGLTASYQ